MTRYSAVVALTGIGGIILAAVTTPLVGIAVVLLAACWYLEAPET